MTIRKMWRGAALTVAAVLTAGTVMLMPATPAGAEAAITRVGGGDRFETAALLAARFGAGAPVYVASGENFPDALAGGPAATAAGGPILLVNRTAVPASTAAELGRLRPGRIVVLGGPAAVDDAVVARLREFTDGSVERRAGADRYETAQQVASGFTPGATAAYLADGTTFADATSAGAAAAAAGAPLLLGNAAGLPPATSAELRRLRPREVVVVASGTALAEAMARPARNLGFPVRVVSGTDPYDTSANLAGGAAPGGSVYLGTGLVFPDGLAAGAVAGPDRAPLMLVRGSCLTQSVRNRIDALSPSRIILLGGPAAVGPAVEQLTVCPPTGTRYQTSSTTVTITDQARGRTLQTTVVTPVGAGGPFPLVVVGHGSGLDGAAAARNHTGVAQAGYVVAAPTFPSQDFSLMPGDVSAVISDLLARSAAGAAPVARLIDPERVAYTGGSMGGMVGLLFYNSCCADARIDAVVARLAYAVSSRSPYAWAGKPPLLMLNGDADRVVSYERARQAYGQAAPPKGLVTVHGAGHDFSGTGTLSNDAITAWFDHYVKGDPAGLSRLQAAVAKLSTASLEWQV